MLPVPVNEVNLFTIYLTPYIPLSFKGEGKIVFEGVKPLQSTSLTEREDIK